jgi:hypothetical protein
MPTLNSLKFKNNSRLSYANSKYKNTVVYKTDQGVPVATMKLNTNRYGTTLILHMGTTQKNFRRRGIGTYIRAQIIKAAKNAGFNFVSQNSVNLANGNSSYPPSARIMNKLGGVKNKNNNRHYTFNLRGKLPNAVLTHSIHKNNTIKK